MKLAAAGFNLSARTAAKWLRRYREHGAAGQRIAQQTELRRAADWGTTALLAAIPLAEFPR